MKIASDIKQTRIPLALKIDCPGVLSGEKNYLAQIKVRQKDMQFLKNKLVYIMVSSGWVCPTCIPSLNIPFLYQRIEKLSIFLNLSNICRNKTNIGIFFFVENLAALILRQPASSWISRQEE